MVQLPFRVDVLPDRLPPGWSLMEVRGGGGGGGKTAGIIKPELSIVT